jgi:malate synthase
MVINALNANVKVFMADFEDSLAPLWQKGDRWANQSARCG